MSRGRQKRSGVTKKNEVGTRKECGVRDPPCTKKRFALMNPDFYQVFCIVPEADRWA